MYFAYELFVKKGPLSRIWLAGTGFKKLKKHEILSSDVHIMCKDISSPPVPLALPTQSTLLRGVCLIENKKASYLLTDAIDAKTKLQQINRRIPKVNLPEKKLAAPHDAIAFDENELGHQNELPDVDTVEDLNRMLDATLDERELGPLEQIGVDLEASLGLGIGLPKERQERQRKARKKAGSESDEERAISLGDQGLELNINLDDEFGLQLHDINFDLPDIGAVLEDAKSVVREAPSPGGSTVSRGTVSPMDTDRRGPHEELEASGLDFKSVVPEALEADDRERVGQDEAQSPARPQRRRKVAIADSTIELTDAQIRDYLHDADELLVLRPVVPDRKRENVEGLSFLPGFAENSTEGVAPELLELFRDLLQPAEGQRKRKREEEEEEEEEAAAEDNEEARREAAKRARLGEYHVEGFEEMKEELPMTPGAFDLRGLEDLAPLALDFDAASVADSVASFDRASRGSMEMVRASAGSRADSGIKPARPSIFDAVDDEEPILQRKRRAVPVEESPIMSQDMDASLSQFELHYKEMKEDKERGRLSPAPGLPPISSEAVRVARKFRRVLEDAFGSLGEEEPEALRLAETIAARSGGHPTLMDMARSFMQVLVLKTQDVIEVEQALPYEDIIITKGPRWKAGLIGVPGSGNTSPMSNR